MHQQRMRSRAPRTQAPTPCAPRARPWMCWPSCWARAALTRRIGWRAPCGRSAARGWPARWRHWWPRWRAARRARRCRGPQVGGGGGGAYACAGRCRGCACLQVQLWRAEACVLPCSCRLPRPRPPAISAPRPRPRPRTHRSRRPGRQRAAAVGAAARRPHAVRGLARRGRGPEAVRSRCGAAGGPSHGAAAVAAEHVWGACARCCVRTGLGCMLLLGACARMLFPCAGDGRGAAATLGLAWCHAGAKGRVSEEHAVTSSAPAWHQGCSKRAGAWAAGRRYEAPPALLHARERPWLIAPTACLTRRTTRTLPPAAQQQSRQPRAPAHPTRAWRLPGAGPRTSWGRTRARGAWALRWAWWRRRWRRGGARTRARAGASAPRGSRTRGCRWVRGPGGAGDLGALPALAFHSVLALQLAWRPAPQPLPSHSSPGYAPRSPAPCALRAGAA